MSCTEVFFCLQKQWGVEDSDWKRLTAVPRHEADSILAAQKQNSSPR